MAKKGDTWPNLFYWLVNLYPVYLGILVAWVLSHFNVIPEQLKIERFDTVISSIISVCIMTIGFFFTIITIFITLFERKVMKFLMEHRGHELLTQYFLVPILAGGILIFYCFYLGIITGASSLLSQNSVAVLIALGLIFTVGVSRIGTCLLVILRLIANEFRSEASIESDKVTRIKPEDLFQTENE
ncbi:hypothetical protein [Desulfosporosinus sp. Sb-LF]|uniref:hypothetical protein n=1 Tax=Desulfosporosinus sp. Sb-LF TaxID=2560027 RepID=UPI00107F3A35|nr:hypothetical protein [Desulfosporosinus sp. Sb-LF]TGE31317.1 hypothetical protein E4K68_17835 [Desulfosporosinus sp. Sb-LF]